MTPRERVFAALAGEMPDRVPFVIWNNKLPGGDEDGRKRLELVSLHLLALPLSKATLCPMS